MRLVQKVSKMKAVSGRERKKERKFPRFVPD